eukprot:s5255_g1.t1
MGRKPRLRSWIGCGAAAAALASMARPWAFYHSERQCHGRQAHVLPRLQARQLNKSTVETFCCFQRRCDCKVKL